MRKIALLIESFEQDGIERPRRGQVAAERLFNDHAGTSGCSRSGKLLDDRAKRGRRDGQIIGRPLRRPEFAAQRLKRRRVVVVAVHVTQQAGQFLKRRRIQPAVLFQAVFGAGFELVQVPAGLGHADDGHVQMCRA